MSEALADYYRQYRESADSHWWFRGRERVLRAVVQPLVRVPSGSLIVDVGSGPVGPTRGVFPDGCIIAVDVSALAFQTTRGVDHCVVGDGTTLPCRPRSVTVVCAFDVLEHLEHDGAALQDWRGVLEPEGWLVLTVPAYAFLWGQHDEADHHYRRYEAAALRRLLVASGFALVRLTYFNSLLLPGVALARWTERLIPPPVSLRRRRTVSRMRDRSQPAAGRQVGGSPSCSSPEPTYPDDCQWRFPRWLERCCEGALQLEAMWLKHRSLPAGVSICAVAQVA